jgi:hypothetical protein
MMMRANSPAALLLTVTVVVAFLFLPSEGRNSTPLPPPCLFLFLPDLFLSQYFIFIALFALFLSFALFAPVPRDHLSHTSVVVSLALLLLSSRWTGWGVVTVCPSGCDYTSVVEAMQAARSADVVQVTTGTYNEDQATALDGKRLTLTYARHLVALLSSSSLALRRATYRASVVCVCVCACGC